MKNILIIGATSAMAMATARCFAREGATFFLVARDAAKLNSLADDLKVHGAAAVATQPLDVNDFAGHQAMLDAALQTLGSIDIALLAHGTLPDQRACEQNVEQTLQEFSTNALSVIALATRLASYFETEKRGTLAVISSVAGDRGRQSNYVYGAAKGAVTVFLQGLRNRLYAAGVKVLTIKPGLVDTPMTAHLPKNFLYASPQQVGQGIYDAIQKGRDEVYLPPFWRLIMLVIRNIPEAIFKRLKL